MAGFLKLNTCHFYHGKFSLKKERKKVKHSPVVSLGQREPRKINEAFYTDAGGSSSGLYPDTVLALMEARVASGTPIPGSPRRPAGALQWGCGLWEWGGGPTPLLLAFSSQW